MTLYTTEKGKKLEKYIAERFKESGLDFRAKRQPGSGNGLNKGDVDNDIGWCVECKNSKNFCWEKTTKQVAREAMGHQKELIVWHPNYRPLSDSVAVLNINDLIDLMVKVKNNRSKEDILDKWQIKNNLNKAVYHLKQVVKDI